MNLAIELNKFQLLLKFQTVGEPRGSYITSLVYLLHSKVDSNQYKLTFSFNGIDSAIPAYADLNEVDYTDWHKVHATNNMLNIVNLIHHRQMEIFS